MAKKGLKYCIFGEVRAGHYINSRQLSPIAGMTGRVNQNVVQVIKDGRVSDIDVEVTGGVLSLELNSDQDDIYNYLLGHSNSGAINFGALDQPPLVGVGVIGVSSEGYKGKIYRRVKFHEPVDENKTRGERVEMTHLMLDGDILIPDDGIWKMEKTYATFNEALAFLQGLFFTGEN